jgi:acyl-CoA-binding protein
MSDYGEGDEHSDVASVISNVYDENKSDVESETECVENLDKFKLYELFKTCIFQDVSKNKVYILKLKMSKKVNE